jgi:MFS family permease
MAVALLWPVALLNYLDRQMLSTIRSAVRTDIPSIASDQDFGALMAVFMGVYALLSPVGGLIADKFNRRWMVIGSLFVWSLVTYLTGLANSYSEMLVYRALMGISEAFYIPAALALITDFHPGGTQARAVGIHQTGIYAGLALGGVGGYIAETSSWRNCFTWFGAAGVIYALILMFALKEGTRERSSASGSAAGSLGGTLGGTLRALCAQPAFWILVVYFTLPAIAGWAAKNWLPTFLADTFHLKQGPAGLSATGYIQLASFGGVLLGGAMADTWMRVNNRGRIYTSAIGTLLLVPALLGLGFAPSLTAAVFFMILFGLGWGLFDCNNMPILCQIVAPEHRATGYGFMNMVSIGVGALATVGLGWMRDHGIQLSMAFALSALLALLAAALVLRIKPRITAVSTSPVTAPSAALPR